MPKEDEILEVMLSIDHYPLTKDTPDEEYKALKSLELFGLIKKSNSYTFVLTKEGFRCAKSSTFEKFKNKDSQNSKSFEDLFDQLIHHIDHKFEELAVNELVEKNEMAVEIEEILTDIRERMSFDFDRKKSGLLNIVRWKLADLVYKNSVLSETINPLIEQFNDNDLNRLVS